LRESPLVYTRATANARLHRASGSELPSAEDRDALATFRRLFRLESRVTDHRQTQDFEDELQHEAASFLGSCVDEIQAISRR